MPKIVVSEYGMTDDYDALRKQCVKFDANHIEETTNLIVREEEGVYTSYWVAASGKDAYLFKTFLPDMNNNAGFTLLGIFDNYKHCRDFNEALHIATGLYMPKKWYE